MASRFRANRINRLGFLLKAIFIFISLLGMLIHGCNGDSVGKDGSDGDGDSDGDVDGEVVRCSDPLPHESYCIPEDGRECDILSSRCVEGEWQCTEGRMHPPPPPEFEDWAWRCEVYTCNAARIPMTAGEDWQDEQPYVAPDPSTLSGEWRLMSDTNSIVPLGCEKRPVQHAIGNCLEVDPNNPNVMYIGLYTSMSASDLLATGVFKSVDGGETWFEARAKLGQLGCELPCEWNLEEYGPAINRLYIDPDDSNIGFASTFERSLYSTLDGGRIWDLVDLPVSCSYPEQVAKSPSGVYFAGCGTLLSSYDDGFTWQSNISQPSELFRRISSIAFDSNLPNRVWLGTGTPPMEGEGLIFRSDDGGENWVELGQEIDNECIGAFSVRRIEICDSDPNKMAVVVHLCGLFLSQDGGLTWARATAPLDGRDVRSAIFAPFQDSCRLYASASDVDTYGVYYNDDFGSIWTKEFNKPLEELFFNPIVPEIMGGLLILGNDLIGDKSLEVWMRF